MNRKHLAFSFSFGLFLAGCGDDSSTEGPDAGLDVGTDLVSDVTPDADTAPDATADADAAPDVTSDADTAPDATSDADAGDTTAPQVELMAVENPANNLSAFVEVTTDEPTTLSFAVTDENEEVFYAWDSEEAELHELFAFGMIPDTTFTFSAVATDAAGNETTETFEFTTGPLPEDFPPLNLVESDPEAMGAGWTFFNVFRWNPGVDGEWGYSIAVDGEGRVRWLYKNGNGASEMQILPNGTIALNYDDSAFDFIDFSGRVLSTWTAAELQTADGLYTADSLHHELELLPNGNYLILDSELRRLGPYLEMVDTDDDDVPDTEVEVDHDVIGDVIIEVTPDGEIAQYWNLFDYYDASITGPSFNGRFWNNHYADVAPDGVKDWTHANAVTYDANDDSFLVSVRHLNSVIKISRETGEVVWDFAPDGTFTMQGDGEFVYHQHAPEFIEGDSNRLLVFDNGNNRRLDSDIEVDFTRAVAFELDTSDADSANWTAAQTWSWISPEFAPFLGDADYLSDSDTVLVTVGGIVAQPMVPLGVPDNQKSARLVEVTFDEAQTLVFDLRITDEAEEEPNGYSVYRAYRWSWDLLASLPVTRD